jgi:hypothetical protein
MFGFLARSFGMILGSVCLSVVPILFFAITSRRRNGGFLRRILLASYRLYHSLFAWAQPFVLQAIGIDILNLLPRTLIASVLSFGIGWGILLLLNWQLGFWLGALFLAHGGFVGWQWELIAFPQDFQMGVRLE